MLKLPDLTVMLDYFKVKLNYEQSMILGQMVVLFLLEFFLFNIDTGSKLGAIFLKIQRF